MNQLRLDSPEETLAVLDYAGDQYQRAIPGYITYYGTLGNNWCNCVSNEKSGIATVYRVHQCFCSSALFSMCEFAPLKSKTNV